MHREKPPVRLERDDNDLAFGRPQPAQVRLRLMAAVWLRALRSLLFIHIPHLELQTGSQIGNRDNKIFGSFRILQPKIYGDTFVMVLGLLSVKPELAMIHFHL